jgi:myo-inositol-1(or 4)-monophosphatase
MAGNSDNVNLQEVHDFLIDLAFKAGEIITNALPEINSSDSKKNSM